MRILYTLNSGKPGGLERYVLDLAVGMVKNGHQVFIWCNEGIIVDWYKNAGAQVNIKPIKFDIDPAYILDLKKFIQNQKIDVLHTNELKAGTNSLIAAYLAKTPVKISHIHTPLSEWKHPNQFKSIIGKFSAAVYSQLVNLISDYEIALTESRSQIKIKEGVKPSKLKVIPNGLDFTKLNLTSEQKAAYKNEIKTKYGIAEETFIFGTNSRLTAEKGVPDLITAFKLFLDNLPETEKVQRFCLLIAGGGALENQIQSQIAALNLTDKIIITGVYSDEDLPKIYAAFDAFVFPTLAEGFGIVLIEAMYAQVPTICSNLEVLQEVSQNTVTFFKPGNSQDMSEKMFLIYRQIKSGLDLTTKAKQLVEHNYSLQQFTQNYLNLYTHLLEGKK